MAQETIITFPGNVDPACAGDDRTVACTVDTVDTRDAGRPVGTIPRRPAGNSVGFATVRSMEVLQAAMLAAGYAGECQPKKPKRTYQLQTPGDKGIIRKPTPGRNDPCRCGCGRKVKKCPRLQVANAAAAIPQMQLTPPTDPRMPLTMPVEQEAAV